MRYDNERMTKFKTVLPNEHDPIERVCVIGAGLIGGSISLAARRAGCTVTVYDTNPESCRLASISGLIVASSPAEAVFDAQVVFLAVPAEEVSAVVPMIRAALQTGVIVTDVASVKEPLHGLRGSLSTTGAAVILGHPMAGSQHYGFSAARLDLFESCTWLLCDANGNPAAGRLASFLRRLGVARVLDCPSSGHDTLVAVASHLPQVAASALAASIGYAEVTIANGALEIAGGGFRDSTRIAESPYAMWQPILQANSAVLVMLLEDLADRLNSAARTLAAGESLEALFADGNACRQSWRNTVPVAPVVLNTPTPPPVRWRDQVSGFDAWVEGVFGWETIRTTALRPGDHVLVSARFVGHLLGVDVTNHISPARLAANGNHAKALVDTLLTCDTPCVYKETWTADGFHVEGIELASGRFLIVI